MEEKPKIKAPGIDEEKKEIRFDFIKSNFFRVLHVDGIYGGLPPGGGHFIEMAVWNERWPIPKQVVYELNPDRSVGKEIEKHSRDAIVREVEAQLIIDIEVAKKVRDWLTTRINDYDELKNKVKAENKSD
jgi:hypothetical protein